MSALANRRALFLVPVCLVVAACAPGMSVPPELAGVDRIGVEKRTALGMVREVRFADFEAVDIDRSWTRGSGTGASAGPIAAGQGRARQAYTFAFRTGGSGVGRVECETTAAREAVGVRSVELETASRRTLSCVSREGVALDLGLGAGRNAHLSGTLVVGAGRYGVQGTGSGGELTPARTRGFEIRRDGRVVAAVETSGKGTVWFSGDIPAEDRPGLAAAALALLLYERIEAD